MPRISVSTEQLLSAAPRIDAGGGGDALAPAGIASAAASTPVDGAWTALVANATAATNVLELVASDLASALRAAAGGYAGTEAHITGSLEARP